jgi:hypothetical protein
MNFVGCATVTCKQEVNHNLFEKIDIDIVDPGKCQTDFWLGLMADCIHEQVKRHHGGGQSSTCLCCGAEIEKCVNVNEDKERRRDNFSDAFVWRNL